MYRKSLQCRQNNVGKYIFYASMRYIIYIRIIYDFICNVRDLRVPPILRRFYFYDPVEVFLRET